MTYDICGDCLHARSCHRECGNHMICAVCCKACEKESFNMIHSASSIIINGQEKVNIGGKMK